MGSARGNYSYNPLTLLVWRAAGLFRFVICVFPAPQLFCELLPLPPLHPQLAIHLSLSCVKKIALPQVHGFGFVYAVINVECKRLFDNLIHFAEL